MVKLLLREIEMRRARLAEGELHKHRVAASEGLSGFVGVRLTTIVCCTT